MNYTKKTCFFHFICAVLVEISTAKSINDSCLKFDITDAFNESIVSIFDTVYFDPDHTRLGLMHSITSPINSYYVTENTRKRKPFADLILFKRINFLTSDSYPSLSWDSSENKTYINFEIIEVFVQGYVDVAQNVSNDSVYFSTELVFKNLSICVTQLHTNEGDRKININASFGFVDIKGDTTILGHIKKIFTYKLRHKMAYVINSILPSMIIDRITHNKDFLQDLEYDFFTQPDREIISKYPDFRAKEEKYYYKIPHILLELISFSDIKIVGLLNFESLEVAGPEPDYIYTLRLNDVSGSMDLNYRYYYKKNKSKLKKQIAEMNFTIWRLSIIVDRPSKRIKVKAKDYSIVEFPRNFSIPITKWVSKFTSTIMEHIESAIAHSIMPSMNVQMKNESSFELRTRQMQNSFIQEHDEIKSSYDM